MGIISSYADQRAFQGKAESTALDLAALVMPWAGHSYRHQMGLGNSPQPDKHPLSAATHVSVNKLRYFSRI